MGAGNADRELAPRSAPVSGPREDQQLSAPGAPARLFRATTPL